MSRFVRCREATSEISQLRTAYQQQAQLIAANTQALQSNTSAQGSHSVASTVGNVALRFSRRVTGIVVADRFGNHESVRRRWFNAAPTLTIYTPPPPIAIDGFLQTAEFRFDSGFQGKPEARPATAAPTQVTVHVNAMDSQSFMDRSSDIANAVREAMLNLHPINDVISNL